MALRGPTSTRKGYRPAGQVPAPAVKEDAPKAVESTPKKKKGLFSRKKK